MSDPKILNQEYPFQKIFVKFQTPAHISSENSNQSSSPKGSAKTDQLGYAKKKRNLAPSHHSSSSSEYSESELELIREEKQKEKDDCVKEFLAGTDTAGIDLQYNKYKSEWKRIK
mmetsp:Transcript_12666/g.12702  ORF Transcript_12666/g.12702 Transcript_12666/m.12702 type:complete len:115 (-) Transcript_12666:106-450(-)